MASAINISVNGLDGEVVARNSGLRGPTINNDLALVRLGESRDGSPGAKAPQATPGAPGGFLAVKLSESATTEEGITVRRIGYVSRQVPPQSLEVPARRDLLLSAVGGRAEAGFRGGDGQVGMNGVDGTPATREVDATTGTDGGNGGDAGQGTNGANGGDGGTIEISVDEDDTHLLFAARYDLSGGEGGAPGSHGEPGAGGKGGHGGPGHKWRELVGHKYHCTSNCSGQAQSSTGTSLVRAGTVVGASTQALLAPIRAQAVEGGNLQNIIASLAQHYGASRFERKDPGSCHCKGGSGNCNGCESVPIHKDLQRVPGRDGKDGRPGRSIDTPLRSGIAGNEGSATIHVINHDGTQQQYTALYKLELLGFDVEDENGDGIFEPGEHVFIRRIRVINTGGMPSPMRPITVTAVASEWFVPLADEGGSTVLTSSIEPGVAVTVEGSIKVLIRRAGDLPPPEEQLFRTESLSIRATMPWLNRTLPCFEYTRHVDIQYPLELSCFRLLPTMAQGSVNQFSYEVHNRSLRSLANASTSRRYIQTRITFPRDCGTLLSSSDDWRNEVDQAIADIPAQQTILNQQTLQIALEAKSYQTVTLQVDLYLSVPIHGLIADEATEVEMILIQQKDLRIQISSHHAFNDRSQFLLVTNSKVSRDRVRSIQSLITKELNMQMDEWNISLYGGLQYRPEHPEVAPDFVMEKYKGKTIIFMGNRFDYFGKGARDACELCDPRLLADVCLSGTGCLFLGNPSPQAFQTMTKAVLLPISHGIENVLEHQVASCDFESLAAMMSSIEQHKVVGGPSQSQVYSLPVKPRWYQHSFSADARLEAEAKRITKILRQKLPQERFLITAFRPGHKELDSLRDRGRLVVLHGLPQVTNFLSCEAKSTTSKIDPFESFVILDSLPTSTKVDLLWSSPSSPFTTKALTLSLLLGINTEIRNFLHKAAWPNQIHILSKPQRPQAIPAFISIHLPLLAKLLQNPKVRSTDPVPDHILTILNYTLASCRPQNKRHIARNIVLPFLQRRRQLHAALLSAFNASFGLKVTYRNGSYTQDKTIHSKFDGSRRDARKSILWLLAEFTQCSEHTFQRARLTAQDVVPHTEWCTREAWDERWKTVEETSERIVRETKEAWQVLGKMVVQS